MLEVKPAKEMKGTVQLPSSGDLTVLGLLMALAAKKTVTVSPVCPSGIVAAWEKALENLCTFTLDGNTTTIEPKQTEDVPIRLTYDDIPCRDFVVPFLLGLGKTIVIDPLPEKRLAAWSAIAADCFSSIQTRDLGGVTGIYLASQDQFRIRDTVKTIDMIHPILGFALGCAKDVMFTIDANFTSSLRMLLPGIGYGLAITSMANDKNENPLVRRMRFLQFGKKSEGPILYKVTTEFSNRKDVPLNITVPGDDTLAAVIIAAKCHVPRGSLIIENAGLESWNTQVLQLVKKMGAVVAIQETAVTTFGSVGTVSFQKLALSGRKVECRPFFQYAGQLPSMIILSAVAQGQSVFRGLEDMRNDIPDGIDQLMNVIKTIGIRHGEMPDGIVIDGGRQYDGFDLIEPLPAHISGAASAMALHCMGKTTINDDELLRRWPNFVELVFPLCEFRD